mmetsp:Transcript_49757/g.117244  ORF Transcript_49757/g.117244 Transcript_49757/m.117244 type:complete len:536 (-) Transcript_49757:425-2032(-)
MAIEDKLYHVKHLDGTMEGWYLASTHGTAAKGAHWITFVVLVCCTMFLFRDSWKAKGPSGRERFFAGYHEEYNISLYVNLFAMICYFGKIVADTMDHNYTNVGPLIIGLGNYRYADYMLTCPLLAYDLLAQVRAPYKITGAVLIFTVLLTGAATNFYPGDAMRGGAYAWFAFGCALYIWAYWLFLTLVKAQYERLQMMAAATEAKKAFLPLRLAVYTFFTIWIVFPVIWVLGHQGLGLISDEVSEVMHCICDLVAKSFYGFALARYRSYFDKKLFAVLEELGYDGEEELAHLEEDLKAMDTTRHSKDKHSTDAEMTSTLGYAGNPGRRGSVERRLSLDGGVTPWHQQRRPSNEWSPVPRISSRNRDQYYPSELHPGLFAGQLPEHGTGMGSPRRFSAFGGYDSLQQKLNSPRKDQAPRSPIHPMLPPGVTVDQLKAQLELLNMQLRAVESQSDTQAVEHREKDELRRARSGGHKAKLQSTLHPHVHADSRTNSSDSDLQLVGDKYSGSRRQGSSRSSGRHRSSREDDAEDGRGLC